MSYIDIQRDITRKHGDMGFWTNFGGAKKHNNFGVTLLSK